MKERSACILYKEWIMQSIDGFATQKFGYAKRTWKCLKESEKLPFRELHDWKRKKLLEPGRKKRLLKINEITEFLSVYNLKKPKLKNVLRKGRETFYFYNYT